MKKIACIFVEIEEGESFQEALRKVLVYYSTASNSFIIERKTNVNNVEYISVGRNVVFDERSANLTWADKYKIIMAKFGITTAYKGYQSLYYIMEAIAENPEQRSKIVLKPLYEHVTKKTGDTSSRIERNVRTFIEKIYERNSDEYVSSILNIRRVFGHNVKNADFIAGLSKVIFE